jgi:hypothetical protein
MQVDVIVAASFLFIAWIGAVFGCVPLVRKLDRQRSQAAG